MEKQEYIVQIQDSLIAEFLYYWIQYGKPCLLLMRRPKTDGLTAIQLTTETPETYQFLETAIQYTGCKLWEK